MRSGFAPAAIELRIKQTYPHLTYNGEDLGPMSLEVICSELMSEWLMKRDFKRVLSRGVVSFEDGKIFITSMKGSRKKPTADWIKAVAAKLKATNPTAVILNLIDESSAFELYKKSSK